MVQILHVLAAAVVGKLTAVVAAVVAAAAAGVVVSAPGCTLTDNSAVPHVAAPALAATFSAEDPIMQIKCSLDKKSVSALF